MSNRLVIFDCDGTLVDSEIIACRVFTSYWSTFGVHFTDQEFKELFIGTGKDAPIVIETFLRMPAHVPVTGDQLLAEALRFELQPVAGIVDILDSLEDEICVASNSSSGYVAEALKLCNLTQYFSAKIFSSHDVARPKPAPDVFLAAAHRLGFSSAECLVIEDSPSGIRAAQVAGMAVIGFAGASHFTPALAQRLSALNPDWFCATTDDLRRVLHSTAETK
jgi:HAD superfamily hydrolase (TIGR01509 family)